MLSLGAEADRFSFGSEPGGNGKKFDQLPHPLLVVQILVMNRLRIPAGAGALVLGNDLLCAESVDAAMKVLTHDDAFSSDVRIQIDLSQEGLGHHLQRIRRPSSKPICEGMKQTVKQWNNQLNLSWESELHAL